MKSNFQFSIFNFQLIMDKENIPEHVAIIMDGKEGGPKVTVWRDGKVIKKE